IPATIVPQLGTSNNIDPTSITGILGLATAGYAYYKNRHDTNVTENRTMSLSGSQLGVADSLKATDQANKDHAEFIAMTLDALSKHPDIAKILNDPANGVGGKSVIELANENKEEWEQSWKQYYENKPRVDGEFSKDPVIARVAEVQKQVTPTPSG
ncbi:MAG TPA: hypothetical protein VFX18_04920, partial [Candidatus Nitrosocosmicus sp.]|nr:hypothetical protein [Candidatus Nitrosocosmicus sp.]